MHVFMKKRIVAILLCAVSFGVYAQQKGDMYIGSMVGFELTSSNVYYDGSKHNEYNPTTGFYVSPAFHYFVVNNLRVGLDFTFGVVNNHFERDISESSYIFDTKGSFGAVGPALAKYVRLSENLYYVPELALSYVHMKSSVEGEYIRRDYVSIEEYNLGTGKSITYRDKHSSGPQTLNGFQADLRFFQLEFRPVKRWGFAMSLLSLSFSRCYFKGKTEIYVNGENLRLSDVEETQISFSVVANPALGVHFYF